MRLGSERRAGATQAAFDFRLRAPLRPAINQVRRLGSNRSVVTDHHTLTQPQSLADIKNEAQSV